MAKIIIPDSYRKWDNDSTPMENVTSTQQTVDVQEKTSDIPKKHSLQLIQKAEQGDVKAQSELGWMYFEGKNMLQDYESSLYWFGRAAEAGDADAQYGLGLQYAEYLGVDMDLETALLWLHKAADQGNVAAKEKIGYILIDHRFLAKDEEEWNWAKQYAIEYEEKVRTEFKAKLGIR